MITNTTKAVDVEVPNNTLISHGAMTAHPISCYEEFTSAEVFEDYTTVWLPSSLGDFKCTVIDSQLCVLSFVRTSTSFSNTGTGKVLNLNSSWKYKPHVNSNSTTTGAYRGWGFLNVSNTSYVYQTWIDKGDALNIHKSDAMKGKTGSAYFSFIFPVDLRS